MDAAEESYTVRGGFWLMEVCRDINNYNKDMLSTYVESHRLHLIHSSQALHELETVIPLFSNQEIGIPLTKVTLGNLGLTPRIFLSRLKSRIHILFQL